MMNSVHRVLRIAVPMVLGVLVQSCGSDSGTGPDPVPPTSLASILLDASDPTISAISDRVAPVSIVFDAPISVTGCSYDAVSQSFTCLPITSGGLTIEHSFTLFDAAGNRQPAFGPTTTASLRVQLHIFGRDSSSIGILNIDDVDDRTVTGLLTARHVLNGNSKTAILGTLIIRETASTTLNDTNTTTIDNLVLPSPSNKWPGPGTITTDNIDGSSPFGPRHTLLRAVFTGTKCVNMSISGAGFTDTFAIDLSNPLTVGCTP